MAGISIMLKLFYGVNNTLGKIEQSARSCGNSFEVMEKAHKGINQHQDLEK